MKNVELSLAGNILTITVDLSKEFGPSSSGKTIIVASTEGNVTVPEREEKIGLNVYRKKLSAHDPRVRASAGRARPRARASLARAAGRRRQHRGRARHPLDPDAAAVPAQPHQPVAAGGRRGRHGGRHRGGAAADPRSVGGLLRGRAARAAHPP